MGEGAEGSYEILVCFISLTDAFSKSDLPILLSDAIKVDLRSQFAWREIYDHIKDPLWQSQLAMLIKGKRAAHKPKQVHIRLIPLFVTFLNALEILNNLVE